ncbi:MULTISPECIES: pyridoxine/pyridoxamine 5'-phosphate oxidase [Kocuria]|uniref:pyridoxine/pyridoxamine 5'-phosphate oxidase n=1 Tax=Kocuria TaxID=57493 RepID=UPI000660929D|nr:MULTISPECIES: pyridoxamine 5'-phosphate oxidase family protein [Kocuria]MCT1367061.1 pyridoxamine 5'-phosphate oxidase family protein [Rothia sp. p3-SID1597]RUQ21765.1 pyridoxamine 5'-phosphate oxidase [Kocuria sp. HSID16901]
MSTLSDQLSSLPSFPKPLPTLDPDHVPSDPHQLFSEWFQEAIASGQRQPHAMTFTTVDNDGTPVGRTLIVKDIDDRGFHFSTHRTSRKGQQLDADPRASMIFFWRESGRQVRVTGVVHPLSREESERDWEGRPSYDGSPNPDWQLYALEPREVEFMQAREDRNHTRIEYRREDHHWQHGVVTTPAG